MLKIKMLILSLFALGFAPLFAQELNFKSLGFSMNSLAVKPDSSFLIMTQYLPKKYGFSANVSVRMQEFGFDLQKYSLISEKQFYANNMEILHRKISKTSLTYEYSGILTGVKLHFYTRVFKRDNFIYSITASDLEESWHRQAKLLKNTVDSFKFNP